MMKYSYAVLLLFSAFILQCSFLNLISVLGTTPNLLLCLVVIFSFLYDDKNYGIILGVVFGLLYDICYMQFVGISSLGYLIIGLFVIVARELLNRENIASALIITALSTLIYNVFVWIMYAILDSNYGFLYMLKFQPGYIIYNIVVVAILYVCAISRVVKHRRDRFYR